MREASLCVSVDADGQLQEVTVVTVERHLCWQRGGRGFRRWRRVSGWEKRMVINDFATGSTEQLIVEMVKMTYAPENNVSCVEYTARVGRP